MANRAPCASIYDLPEEILISILSLIVVDPPSIVHASEVPSALLWQTLEYPNLKNFSLVCRDWRRIAFPILFRYIKIDLNGQRGLLDDSVLSNAAVGSKTSEFDAALAKVTISILLYSSSSVRYTSSSSVRFMLRNLVQHLLRLISPSRLLVVMEPALMQHLMSVQMNTQDAWAFEISYQSIEYRQHRSRLLRCFCGKHESCTTNVLGVTPWNLLQFQEWDEMIVHGGNCLTNFGTCM